MSESSASKSLFSLAWPLIISFTVRALLGTVDLLCAKTLGDSAIAAIGLYFPLEFTFIACWVGASAALTSHLGRAMGERHEGRLRQLIRVMARIVTALMVLFLAVALGVYLAADHLQLEPETAAQFKAYAPVAMSGAALCAFWSVIPDSIVKAHHDTVTTMIAGLISGIGNLVLNLVFLFVFEWGIFGIGLATGLARLGSLSFSLWRARKLEAARREAWAKEPPPAPPTGEEFTAEGLLARPLKALLLLGVPSSLTYVLMATEGFLVNGILSRFADATEALAAYAIYSRSMMLTMMPVIGTAVAVLPFVSRLVGERRFAEVRGQLRQAFLFAGGYLLLVALPACQLFGGKLADFLGHGELTRDLATFAIRWATPVAALATMPFLLCRPAFEALQRGAPGLIMATLRYAVLSAPLGFLGAHVARELGRSPFHGLIAGLIVGSGVVSSAFLVWLVRTLRALD